MSDNLKEHLAEKLFAFVQHNFPKDKKLLEMDNISDVKCTITGKTECVLTVYMQHGYPRYFKFKLSEILG